MPAVSSLLPSNPTSALSGELKIRLIVKPITIPRDCTPDFDKPAGAYVGHPNTAPARGHLARFGRDLTSLVFL
jgi:hypothetical protein